MQTDTTDLHKHMLKMAWRQFIKPSKEKTGAPICKCGLEKKDIHISGWTPTWICPECWGKIDGREF